MTTVTTFAQMLLREPASAAAIRAAWAAVKQRQHGSPERGVSYAGLIALQLSDGAVNHIPVALQVRYNIKASNSPIHITIPSAVEPSPFAATYYLKLTSTNKIVQEDVDFWIPNRWQEWLAWHAKELGLHKQTA